MNHSRLSKKSKKANAGARSLLMGRVRHSGTACELAVRSAVHRAGYRYRLDHGKGLPGRPDIVLRQIRVAIFVDGCFWHGCPQHGTLPKTNSRFWAAKIRRNRGRDKKNDRLLKRLGWKPLHVWEHDTKTDAIRILSRIAKLS